jgi:SP family general alpha glucoside:H+ symporter-like MFS transporter
MPSFTVLTRFGRRTLYLSGLFTMACVLLIIGGMGFTDSQAAKWVSGGMLVFLNLASVSREERSDEIVADA